MRSDWRTSLLLILLTLVSWLPLRAQQSPTSLPITIDRSASGVSRLSAAGRPYGAGLRVNDQDQEIWDNRFGIPGPNGEVYAIAASGSDIYIGGTFTQIGNLQVNHIARWDGHQWHPLGSNSANGVDQIVLALTVDGDNLYVGGQFSLVGDNVQASNIAIWHPSSSSWAAMGDGVSGGTSPIIYSMTMKSGHLYIGGSFTRAGSTLVSNVAVWDGNSWSALGGGITGRVGTLAINGDNLYVGGTFTKAGSTTVSNIAAWSITANTWSALTSGVDGNVRAIAGTGNDVYVGGTFANAGGIKARNIAKWNDASRTWTTLDTMITNGSIQSGVSAIAIDGDNLYVGGDFRMGQKTTYDRLDSIRSIGRWDINAKKWSAMGPNLVEYDNQSPLVDVIVVNGRQLLVGGKFPLGGFYETSNVSVYDLDANTWVALTQGVNGATAGYVLDGRRQSRDTTGLRALLADGNSVYVGGIFNSAGGKYASSIARFDGTNWTSLGTGVGDSVVAFATPPTVTAIAKVGNDLYVGGRFNRAGSVRAKNIAKWDGSQWSAMVAPSGGLDTVFAIAAIGNDIYAGGVARVSNLPTGVVFRWNGTGWDSLGLTFDHAVRALAVYNNRLYVGGEFTKYGQTSARGLVSYDPTTGTISAVTNGPNNNVRALAVSGNDIYVGGDFDQAGGVSNKGIVRWNPTAGTWTPLGSGFTKPVRAIALYSGGIYVGGDFDMSSGDPGNYVARWDGTTWNPLGSGTDSRVMGIAAVGNELYMGGYFLNAGGMDAHYFAHWTRIVLGVREQNGASVASTISLASYPNPVVSSATIAVELTDRVPVSLSICSANGEVVASLFNGTLDAGSHQFTWTPTSGVEGAYFCILRSGDHVATQKLVVVK